jgi:pimeloyl-ACP methyl ester carboxylesterase
MRLALLALLWSGCGFMRIARDPMESVAYRAQGPNEARGVIVLLPGFGDDAEAFAEHGIVDVLSRVAPELDVVSADAHFGYYRKRSLLGRLDHDVIAPLRARGYREIWLLGTSMGGFGAIAYARTYPERVRGVFLLAPYLGPKDVVKEVADAGLCAYDEQPGKEDDEENFARANFQWLKRQACTERSVSLYLGVGSEDRLRRPDNVIGSALPASHYLVLPGGHGWKVWTPALERLAQTAFDRPSGTH